MSDLPQIERIEPRSKDNFFETFKDILHLTPANLDEKYSFYLNHPENIKHTFKET